VGEFDAWRAVADGLEEGYIATLHGFCARLLREHALRAEGVDPGFETLEDADARSLMHETVDVILDEQDREGALAILAEQFSRPQLHDILVDMIGQRPDSARWAERWHDTTTEAYLEFVDATLHPIDPETAADRLADPAFVEPARRLIQIVSDPPPIDTGGRAWRRAETVVGMLADGFDDGVTSHRKQALIAELSLALTTTKGELYSSYTGAKTRWKGHERAKADFDAAFGALVAALEPVGFAIPVDRALEERSVEYVRALATLTRRTLRAYADRKAELNALDFSDLVSGAIELLSADANADVRDRLQRQFDHILLDEFQDTDPRQWELIQLLTGRRRQDGQADSLFVVGDAKQSIYRFRNADVTQFREIAESVDESAMGQ
jgi:ATP-dependent exoDNAse (exonuclease V) beta subunit (contains helicase and exonuclease domains)